MKVGGVKWRDSAQLLTISSAGSWVDVDVSAYVPSGASGVILFCVNQNNSNRYKIAVRKNGSTDDWSTYGKMSIHASRKTIRQEFTGIDSNRKFEAYIENATDCKIYLLGYTDDDIVFFDNAYNKTPSLRTWSDVDCSAEIPSGATGAIVRLVNQKSTGEQVMSVRKNGSTDNYTQGPDQSLVMREGFIDIFVGIDGGRILEAFLYTWGTDLKLYLLGYTKGRVTFFTNGTRKEPVSTEVWEDIDVSALVPESTQVLFYHQHSQTGGYEGFNARQNGSADDFATGYNYDGQAARGGVVGIDGSRIFEEYRYNASQIFNVVGYGYTVTEINLYEEITITENVNANVWNYESLVYDSPVITEDVSLDVFDVFGGYDEITATESVSASLDVLNINVYDTATVVENVIAYPDIWFVDIYDSSSIVEFADTIFVWNLSVYDEVNITEFTERNIAYPIDIYESFSLQEYIDFLVYNPILELQKSLDTNIGALCHFNGNDGDTNTEDSSSYGHAMTMYNGAELDSAYKVFGATACKFVRANSQYVTVASNSVFAVGSNNMTWEVRVRFASFPITSPLITYYYDGNNFWYLYINKSGETYYMRLYLKVGGVDKGGSTIDVTSEMAIDTWITLAITKSGTIIYHFVDGIMKGSHDFGTDFPALASGMELGRFGSNYFDGWLDEAYYNKSQALWTSDYTVAISPWGDSTLEESLTITEDSSFTFYDYEYLVYETVGITENVSLSKLTEGIDSHEEITVVENVDLGLDNLFIDVFNTITLTEYIDLNREYNLSVYDEITGQENLVIVIPELNIFIYEEVGLTESITPNLVLVINNYEDILITEVAQVFDIIIEVGVVVDTISIQETTVVLLTNFCLAVYDESSITEYIEILDLIIDLYAEDNLIIDETSTQGLDVLNYNRYDEIAIEENVIPALIINVNIYDQVSIIEQINIVDLVVEITVVEIITIIEWTQILDLIIELNIEELIGVVENTALIPIYFFTTYENINLAENFEGNMPINFEAVEQAGIAITTVAGW